MKAMVAFHTIRDKVLFPVLRQIESNKLKPYDTVHSTVVEKCFHALHINLKRLFDELGIAA